MFFPLSYYNESSFLVYLYIFRRNQFIRILFQKCLLLKLVWGTANLLFGEGGLASETQPIQQTCLGEKRNQQTYTIKDSKVRLNTERNNSSVANLSKRSHQMFIQAENLPILFKFEKNPTHQIFRAVIEGHLFFYVNLSYSLLFLGIYIFLFSSQFQSFVFSNKISVFQAF